MTGDGRQAARPANAHRWASRLDSGSLLYGTIVSTAALAVGAGRGETTFGMDEAMVTTLIVYWLAHVYTKTVSERRPVRGWRLAREAAVAAVLGAILAALPVSLHTH
jgi:hypothetical protein